MTIGSNPTPAEHRIARRQNAAAFLFLLAVLVAGLVVFDDYGVTWDEADQRTYGEVVHEYVFEGDRALLNHRDRYHGPGFEFFLVAAERAFRSVDIRGIWLQRHLLTFLSFFAGVVFFHLLCSRYFRDKLYGLAGSVLLVLSPVVFAHSFFNSKDIPALSLFTISVYTLLRFVEAKSLRWAILHGLASALLMSIRVTGLLVPVITVAAFVTARPGRIRQWSALGGYVLLWWLLTVAFWPTLWESPVSRFLDAFREMSSYPWEGKTFYMGQYIKGRDLPWHYIPVWMAITTPVEYTGAALLGLCVGLAAVIGRKDSGENTRNRLVVIGWFLLPLLSVVILDSIVYDAWRHLFFIYPAFLILALEGVQWLFGAIKRIPSGRLRLAVDVGLKLIIARGLLATLVFMVSNHPLQHVYFSVPRSVVAGRFELDYWGASYRQALERLLARDPAPRIPIKVGNLPGALNVGILPEEDRQRIVLVGADGAARYFLTNMRFHYTSSYGFPEAFAVEAGGLEILKVFSLAQGADER